MSLTLRKLYTQNNNPFKLTLVAGANSVRNIVTWCYVFEDRTLVRYLRGSDLVVTSGLMQEQNPDWLMLLTEEICAAKAAGLIVNTGGFVHEIPQNVIDYCNEHDFPLLTMPWEINSTEMIQTFCTSIVNERQEYAQHDKALLDAALKRDNVEEYTNTLSQYYDVNESFTVILLHVTLPDTADQGTADELQYRFVNQIRRLKTQEPVKLKKLKVGVVKYESYYMFCLNACPSALRPKIQDAIISVYGDLIKNQAFYAGIGTQVHDLTDLSHSFDRARTATRMAKYLNQPFVHFEDMGFYQVLFSVRDNEVLYAYADQLLQPLDEYDARGHEYVKLLESYIANDRSLERTAAELYIHRNTVNYQVQKMKQLLDNPLKTVEDLLPYRLALAIRDIEESEKR